MAERSLAFAGFTPYLHYSDLVAMIEWLTRIFGFVEKGRWVGDTGHVTNAELLAGSAELWLDGDPNWWKTRNRQPEEWIGVWVNSVDAMYERVSRSGVTVEAPELKFYGVRILQVTDPEGYRWGFMERAPYVARSPSGGSP